MDFIIWPLVALGGMGAAFGLALGFFQKIFAVETDPLVDEILEALPGANCGGCGFPGCGGLATAIADGKAPANACPVGGKALAEKIAGLLGVDAGAMVRKTAFVKCGGDCDKSTSKYEYSNVLDCTAATTLAGGGAKECRFGCTGLGSCVNVCQFDAIDIVNGLAVVDPDKCVACNACVKACPKDLIELIPYLSGAKVLCNSTEKGKDVKEKCTVGCIGCKLCVKACKFEAIEVENNLSSIIYDKCTNCGECVLKCPTKSIKFSLRRKNLDA